MGKAVNFPSNHPEHVCQNVTKHCRFVCLLDLMERNRFFFDCVFSKFTHTIFQDLGFHFTK